VKGNGTTGKLSAHYTYRADFDTLVENEGTLVVDGGILYGANLKKADSEYYTIKNVKDTAVAKILSGAVTNNPVNVVGTITKNAGVQVVAPEGYGWQNDTDLHGCNHSIETVVGATTETNGYVLHECVCGESYKDGYFTWSKGVAVVDGYYFRTLQDAINYAAGSNAEITLLKDSVGAGLEIEGDVTINFADYYYSASAPVEGTNAAMKIAQDATVTLTGNGEGKLSAHYTYRADFNTLIVNEGTLVVDGAMLYGKNLDKADECYIVTGNTAEFLSGTVVVNNSGTTYGNPEEAA